MDDLRGQRLLRVVDVPLQERDAGIIDVPIGLVQRHTYLFRDDLRYFPPLRGQVIGKFLHYLPAFAKRPSRP